MDQETSSPKEEGILPVDCLWIWTATSLSIQPISSDFGLTKLTVAWANSLKFLSLSPYMCICVHIYLYTYTDTFCCFCFPGESWLTHYENEKLLQHISSETSIFHFQQWIKQSRQKINKEIGDLNNIINQLDLTSINMLLGNSRTCIFLKYTWKILQQRPYIKP